MTDAVQIAAASVVSSALTAGGTWLASYISNRAKASVKTTTATLSREGGFVDQLLKRVEYLEKAVEQCREEAAEDLRERAVLLARIAALEEKIALCSARECPYREEQPAPKDPEPRIPIARRDVRI